MAYPLNQLFLHFFDTHFFDERAKAPLAAMEARVATRLALMLAERVFVPAASYLENDQCRAIIDEYSELFGDGSIVLVGGEDSLHDYATAKLLQYDEGTRRHEAYARALNDTGLTPAFYTRARDTTAEIGRGWLFRANELGRVVRGIPDGTEVSRVERRWGDVPEALGPRAFITDNVMPLLGVTADHASGFTVRSRISTVINDEYFHSFVREFRAAVTTDLVYLAGFNADPDIAQLPYRELRSALLSAGLLEVVMQSAVQPLRQLHERADIATIVLPIFERAKERLLTPSQLQLPIGTLKPAVDKLSAIKSGRKDATKYARAVQTILSTLFRYSLGESVWEAEINEGRKRIDILYPNIATAGAFHWARQSYAANFVVVECKNYKEDPTNPEVDQLGGRMSDSRGRFGFLLFRQAKDFNRLMARCIDWKRDMKVLLVPLCDRDLVEIADYTSDPGVSDLSATLIGKRMVDISKA